jgi:hypothetical protein
VEKGPVLSAAPVDPRRRVASILKRRRKCGDRRTQAEPRGRQRPTWVVLSRRVPGSRSRSPRRSPETRRSSGGLLRARFQPVLSEAFADWSLERVASGKGDSPGCSAANPAQDSTKYCKNRIGPGTADTGTQDSLVIRMLHSQIVDGRPIDLACNLCKACPVQPNWEVKTERQLSYFDEEVLRRSWTTSRNVTVSAKIREPRDLVFPKPRDDEIDLASSSCRCLPDGPCLQLLQGMASTPEL